MTRAGDVIEDYPGERRTGVVPRKAFDQCGHGSALPAGIDHQRDWPAGDAGEFGGRAGFAVRPGAVEEAHHAFAQHQLGGAFEVADQAREGRRAHRPGVEVEAWRAARQRVKGRIDVVRAGLGRRDPDPAMTQMPQQPRGDQRLAAARCRCGEDEALAAHPFPYQSSVACNRATSPITMIAGLSTPDEALAAFASEVMTTRCAAVVALLTMATASSGARPAATRRRAMSSRWFKAM